MRNTYTVDGDRVLIQVAPPKRMQPEYPAYLDAQVDLKDLPKLLEIRTRWYAHPARAPKGKFYVLGKLTGRTIMMHRIIAGEPDCEVHHEDNDGLNNRRKNLWYMNHRQNMRARQPKKDWDAHDANKARIAVFKRLVAIGAEIQAEFGITRQAAWNIRKGNSRRSPAAKAYWKRVCADMPQVFKTDIFPWIIARDYIR